MSDTTRPAGVDLRPLDWRFYLARQTWGTALVGRTVPEEITRAIRRLAHQVGDDTSPPERAVDLVVATSADLGRLRSKILPATELNPDAVVVVLGGHSPSWGQSSQRRSALPRPPDTRVAKSLTLVSAALPDHKRTALYPDSPAVWRRYVWLDICPPVSLKGRLARLGLAWPGRCAVTLLRERVITIWHPDEQGLHPWAGDLIVLTGGSATTNPAIALVHADRPGHEHGARVDPADDPGKSGLVVKLPREPGQRAGLEREARKLRRLRARLGGDPTTAGRVHWGADLDGWAQPLRPGVPLDRQPVVNQAPAAGRLAVWLAELRARELHLVRTGAVQPPDATRWASTWMPTAAAHLSLTPAEADAVEALPSRIHDAGITLTYSHRDAGYWNVLVDRGRPHLVDWESAGWSPAGDDVLYLAVHLLFHASGRPYRAETMDTFRREFIGPEHRPTWLTALLTRLATDLHADPEAWSTLLETCFLRHAVRWVYLSRTRPHRAFMIDLHRETWRALMQAGPGPWLDVAGHGSRRRSGSARPTPLQPLPTTRDPTVLR